MRSIRTLSAAPDANAWLAKTCHPRILHVFDQAFNLINEHREILSIVTGKIGKGPFNLVVEDAVLFSEHLQVESPVSMIENGLIAGNLTFEVKDTNFWSPRPAWERLHDDRGKISSQLAAFPVPDSDLPSALISDLSSAVASGDIACSKLHASHLAGLGTGLTPAGDDFLLGALYAAWIIHAPHEAALLAREIADRSAPLTTSLSAAWLRCAGKGEAGVRWHELLEALCSSDSSGIQSTMKEIMSMGATSGLEALAGFISTFHSYRETKKTDVLPRHI
jgi:hypothetical protein